MTRPYFESVVHIEGMDLAGKTTVTANLSRTIGAVTQRNCLVSENPVYTTADEIRRSGSASSEVLGPLYVSALRYDLEHLQKPVTKGIQDSTILLRSIAYNAAVGDSGIVHDLLAEVPRHPRFRRTIVLTASIDARRRRLDERRLKAPEEVAADDLMVETAPLLFTDMDIALRRYALRLFNAMIIDTSKLSKIEVERAVALTLDGDW